MPLENKKKLAILEEDKMEDITKDLEQKETEKKDGVPSIRTYKNDVSSYIKKEGKTLSDIAIAEQNRKNRNLNNLEISDQIQRSSTKKIILAVIFLVLGSLTVFLFFFIKNKYQNNNSNNQQTNQIEADIFDSSLESKNLQLDNLQTEYVFDKIDTKLKESEEIHYIKITNNGKLITGRTLLESLNIYVPSELARSLKNDFAIGSMGGNARFIILKISYYANAFSGMLKWEKNIYKDLKNILGLKNESFEVTGTTTSSYNLKTSMFYDGIISNRDSRILRDGQDKTLLVYSFIDDETLVITSNENLLKVITQKLTIKR